MVTPTPPIDQQACGNCVMSRIDPLGVTTCHVAPPKVILDRGVGIAPLTVWPVPPLGADDWCGLWEADPQSETAGALYVAPSDTEQHITADEPQDDPDPVVPRRAQSRRK